MTFHRSLHVLVLLGAILLSGCQSAAGLPASSTQASQPAKDGTLQRFEYHAMKMGSNYNLVLYAPDKAAADAAAQAAEAEIDRLDAVFSDYNPESELSKLSRLTSDGPMTEPVEISPDLYNLLVFSQALAKLSDGAFDVTVGPYVQLWRRSRRQQELPRAERLAEAKKSVGWQSMVVSPTPDQLQGGPDDPKRTVRLTAADMRLDLGGIATGYISDRVLGVLKDRGIRSAICDLSGDLAIGDPPPGKTGWKIAIQSLTAPTEVAEYLMLSNCGVSTSGDTYRFVEIDGVRYSHIVDPKTGLGLTHRIGVTVIARDGVTADALATTISILGVEKGMKLADEQFARAEAAVRVVVEKAGSFETVKSARYKKLQ